jgi:hypothetical protein
MKSNQIVKFILLLRVFISIPLLIKVAWGASVLGSVYKFINYRAKVKGQNLFYEISTDRFYLEWQENSTLSTLQGNLLRTTALARMIRRI